MLVSYKHCHAQCIQTLETRFDEKVVIGCLQFMWYLCLPAYRCQQRRDLFNHSIQARKTHHELCYVCLRAPELDHQGRSGGEEVVFCQECPRMVCAPCHIKMQPAADRNERVSLGVRLRCLEMTSYARPIAAHCP